MKVTEEEAREVAERVLLQTLANAVDNVNEYRWHDIRMQPDDLPEIPDGEEYIPVYVYVNRAKYGVDEKDAYTVFEFDGRFRGYDGGQIIYVDDGSIVAWKYIEKFETQWQKLDKLFCGGK